MCQTRFLSSTTDETVLIGTTQPRPLVQVNEFGTWRYKFESTCQFLPTFIFNLKSNHWGLRICVYPKLGGPQDETDCSCRTVHRSFWTAETVKRSISQPSYWPWSSITQGGHQGLPSHSVRLFLGSWQGSRPFKPKWNLESGLFLKLSKDYGIVILFCIYYINYTIEVFNSDRP